MTRAIYSLAREIGITPDDRGYAGELRRLFDGRPGIRRAIFRHSGLTVDSFSELAWSRGITPERLSCSDMLELLDLALTPADRRKGSESARDRGVIDAEAHALEVRRKTRLRLYLCTAPGCHMKLRVANDNLDASHNHWNPETNGLQVYPFKLSTPILRPVAPF